MKPLQVEVTHANRIATMEHLSASIAHEINQPIAATIINAQAALRLLDAQTPDLEEIRQALGGIVRDANRTCDLISALRALMHKEPPRKDNLNINEAVREIIALARAEGLKNDVLIETRLAEGLPPIQGDRVLLQQVILNLIINAFEAMRGAGHGPRELLISSARSPDGVLVAVADSGPGLPLERIGRLFESFYTTKLGGLGMGLSICRTIIEHHGGRLWATANVPRGALFQFTVPVHRAARLVKGRGALTGPETRCGPAEIGGR
jgi:C4-dicarboxylate-specific signal transduction histidine kinase